MKMKKFTACLLAGAMTLSVALTGCGSKINPEAVGATLNGEEISLGLMNFMARYQQATNDANYLSYFGTEIWNTDMWQMDYTEGVTMEESTKDAVLDLIETVYLLEDHMADYGVALTEEELASIEAAAKQFMEDNSKKAIKQLGAAEEYVKEMLRIYTVRQKMQEAIYEASEAVVTEEEAKQRTFSYFRASTTTGKDEDGNNKEYTDEEKEAFAEEMKEVAAAAKEDFDGAAEDKGYTVSSYSYGADETSMDEAVIKAADAMKEGDISELITTDDYYYVIRLDSEFDKEKTEQERELLLNQKKLEEFNAICDSYKEEAAFEVNEEAWATVKFDRLFGVAAPEE